MEPDLQTEIGLAAGDVYRYLYENGETNITRLAKELGVPARQVDRALGWLAREGKLEFAKVKRTTVVSLRT